MDAKLTKLYYSIGEVSEMFGVSQSLLRYWQTEFPRLDPKTNKKGDRKYTKKEIAYIQRIYDFVKVKGYTLEGARRAMRKSKPSNPEKEMILGKLNEIKEELKNLSKDLE